MSDEIEDFVQRWHDSDSKLELHEYLGMTIDEYALWLNSPDMLPLILTSRKTKRSLESIANDNLQSRLAARADDSMKIKAIQTWLSNRPTP